MSNITTADLKTPRIRAAIERINGSITDDESSVIYYDDSTQKYYLGDIDDLGDLADLMEDADEDVARDAYSHWCAGTSHPECDSNGVWVTGQRVEAGDGSDRDTGIINTIDGDTCTVNWESRVTTPCDLSALRRL